MPECRTAPSKTTGGRSSEKIKISRGELCRTRRRSGKKSTPPSISPSPAKSRQPPTRKGKSMLEAAQRYLAFADAVREGLDQAMEAHPEVIVIGEGVPDPQCKIPEDALL